MPAKRLTEQNRQKVIAALNVNPNATAVAREIGGVSVAGVWKIARKAGIELTAGIDAAAVAREVGGVSGVGVWNIAQVEGIELRHSGIDQARRRRGVPSRGQADPGFTVMVL